MTTLEPVHGGQAERIAALADALAALSDARTPYMPSPGLCALIDATLGGEPVESVFGRISDIGIGEPDFRGAFIALTAHLAAWVSWYPPDIDEHVEIAALPRSGFRSISIKEPMSKLEGKLSTRLTLTLSHDSLGRVEVPVRREEVADVVATLLGSREPA
ncbi:hypothetical protein Xcel_0544 [Xylanimonas cellulosilytica DSM 15894]|uniref:Uncharacterized protein n=1 Tax=Xylanimonas cellulosilytica (strain DSM 15894 / JCM 12276 / CECT 5975 / KCTC 9989 / LMG 20990 / NBRC 107835 / XIL07) TaxID=446471 RepID=D1BW80_XYLCX|nr:hypothetical protein [Xylanimonas cellulosilytica]ACZ29583.1 hypothetical protein Xcel_0544 [Xylanimonas cellulosilytica DSM 15894]